MRKSKKPYYWVWSIITWHLLSAQQSTEHLWDDFCPLWVCIAGSLFQANYPDTQQNNEGTMHKSFSIPIHPNSICFLLCCCCLYQTLCGWGSETSPILLFPDVKHMDSRWSSKFPFSWQCKASLFSLHKTDTSIWAYFLSLWWAKWSYIIHQQEDRVHNKEQGERQTWKRLGLNGTASFRANLKLDK